MSEPIGKGPIRFQFIVGGGWNLTFDYRIVGGPDDGTRITSLPDRGDYADQGAKGYNGPEAAYKRIYGKDVRPCWRPEFLTDEFSAETISAATQQFGPLWGQTICPMCGRTEADHALEGDLFHFY